MRDVDLDVVHGERRVILGPNGAGKTTLFNVISGDMQPSSGTIEAFGEDITLLPARRRAGLGIARTYQTSRLFLGLSVVDNLYLAQLGVHAAISGRSTCPAATVPSGEREHSSPRASGSEASSRRSSARSRTASSGSSRSGWRGPGTRS